MSRWILTDSSVPEIYTFETNPNRMSSPFVSSQTVTGASNPRFGGRIRAVRRRELRDFSFGGNYFSQTQYEALAAWCKKGKAITLTDHLGRTFTVLLSSFDPDEARPSKRYPWKGTYTVRGWLL